jgi:hypothetical protein
LAPSSNGVALMAGLGASGAGFAAGGAPGMAVGAFSPAVGYLAKKAADRITTGAMDRLGDLARVGGDASALQAPLNAVQSAARSAAAPVSAAITNLGILSSLGRAEPDSRAASLAELLAKYNPPAGRRGDGRGFRVLERWPIKLHRILRCATRFDRRRGSTGGADSSYLQFGLDSR